MLYPVRDAPALRHLRRHPRRAGHDPEPAPGRAVPGLCYHCRMTKKKPRGSRAVAVGRPTVFTEDTIQKLEEAFKIDATVREACAYAGIAESTYYAEAKDNPVFSERMDRA